MAQINIAQELEDLRKKIDLNRELIALENNLELHSDHWQNYLINQFTSAYDGAYVTFKDYLNKQHIEKQQRLELAMFALSLCGGSAYTAILGNLGIGRFLANHALRIVCERNMGKMFRALAMVEGSQVAQFIIGQTATQAGKWAGNRFRNSLAKILNYGPKIEISTTKQIEAAMMDFYFQAVDVVRYAFKDLADNRDIKKDDRIKILAQILNSPFCRAPVSHIWPHPAVLSDKIELSFYLKMVLTSGYELFYVPKGGSYGKRIHVPPSDSRFPPQHSTNGMYGSTVRFDDIGDSIAKRINELYRKPFVVQQGGMKEDLVYDGFWFDGATYNNIKKVEKVLDLLGEQTAMNALQSIQARKEAIPA